MIYCLVDAESLGFKLNNSEAAKLVEVGERIKRAAAVQIPCVHPENPDIHTINQTLFAGPLHSDARRQALAQHRHRLARAARSLALRHGHERADGGAARARPAR